MFVDLERSQESFVWRVVLPSGETLASRFIARWSASGHTVSRWLVFGWEQLRLVALECSKSVGLQDVFKAGMPCSSSSLLGGICQSCQLSLCGRESCDRLQLQARRHIPPHAIKKCCGSRVAVQAAKCASEYPNRFGPLPLVFPNCKARFCMPDR